ncbi:DUF4920 domain-containing protein [Seonamhaeicola maritimus]|uniref:DUF4920 domain-containing protein n=1 Tax=Seonamhaeicola maritimus TaxID=2591822 RepID=UPI002494B8C4|nr:DUF4920 domain-containing protein [Seonamhaeicola maritimus]
MKPIIVLIFCTLVLSSCKNKVEETKKEIAKIEYASFGDKIEAEGAKSATEVVELYKDLKVGDTIDAKFEAKINSVCQKKGCWMRLDLENDSESFVRFKDYGFFMPLNAEGEVIVNGKAFVSEVSVEELRHYAEDAGKSEEEIAAIVEPKRTLSFEADGVLLKQ